MGFGEDLRLWINIIKNPGKYAGKEMSIANALKLYYEASIIPFVLALVVGIPIVMYGTSTYLIPFSRTFVGMGMLATLAYVVGLIVSLWIITPIGIFVDAFLYHIVGKYILNAWKRPYDNTFAAALFATLPMLFLYWLLPVPFINIFIMVIILVWSFIVLIISLALQQKTTRVNAFVAIIATIIFTLLAVMVFVALLEMALLPAAIAPMQTM